jgi:hypothetical protein
MTLELAPITTANATAVADFLHANFYTRVPASTWLRTMTVPWKVDAPNLGFLIRNGDAIVGVHLAFYSERLVDGRPEGFCNLGAWCVLPEFRFQGFLLLRALLAQDGYHFTDLSPSGNVVPLNKRLKFQMLDTSTAVIPNLPWPNLSLRRLRISADPEEIERVLTGPELDLYHDHEQAAAVHHLVLRCSDQNCYVMFRKVTRKRLPVFASILHVSDTELFHQAVVPLARYLLFRYRVVATFAELRIVGRRPRPSLMLSAPRPKMYRSSTLDPGQIDDLYSELVCVPW